MNLPSKLKLVSYNNPILKETMPLFDFNGEINPEELALKLVQSMRDNNGFVLAANQVGVRARAFAINSDPAIVCFNARIIDQSSEMEQALEGCLSFPNLTVKIKRFKVIKVRFATYDGNVMTKQYQDLTARLFQNGLDYLNGKNFLDSANYLNREIAKNKWKKIVRQGNVKYD